MKFISWNIDSLNAALTSDSPRALLTRDVLTKIASENADIIAIQETKLPEAGMNAKQEAALSALFPDYEVVFVSSCPPARKGYAGTMALVKKGINPIAFDGLRLAQTAAESKEINEDFKPKIILSSSGMCEGGRIRHHLKHNLWRKESTVLFVGYQSNGTLGRLIADGAEEVKIFGEPISVKAEVAVLAGISGHADKAGLMNWVSGFKTPLKHVFVVHGEDETCSDFAVFLKQQFGFESDAPFSGSIYDLAAECYELRAEAVPVRNHKKEGKKSIVDPFPTLQNLGRRLGSLITSYKGRANRDIRAFSSDLEHLCEKYENNF